MKKIDLPERPGWRDRAAELGFTFADMGGEPYWDESSAYRFTLAEVENDIEDPSTELHTMVREAVATALASDEWLSRMDIPSEHWDFIADSWKAGEPELYGRMDLAYDGNGPAKLLEYNADTPTSLYESASFQWLWLEDQQRLGVLSPGTDQFNAIHEALATRWAEIAAPGTDIHFAADKQNPEDYATVEALGWAAREADLGAHFTDLAGIGLTEEGQFADDENRVIGTLFKLYPWEDMLRDDFAQHLASSQTRFIEPPWKAVVSNKAILPLLWQMFPGHPNLLPAFFEADVAEAMRGGTPAPRIAKAFEAARDALRAGHVSKPIFSREGAGVVIHQQGREVERAPDDSYDHHVRIVQALAPLPDFGGFYPVVGAWIVGEACVGMGLREDASRITHNLSRFKPHYIEG
ncbi:MAG TPA: glutathionylspermidine synthase family protein [Paracoccus sp. (in: a-proteobacteria)]|uniref:glutathionylspermidine synthase family protein n=1 Tax=uncultured Paracoccus sp. TaxID=189685 RepID=UPI00260E99D6|nr:glutathionylspermidine synthase family protein [uncultured Paracoccus sp.]HMQ41238.1 glutathionylspermidine synthase family protein [Paracoccus sp. (in: a-proteobacteria)]HMR37270.1 glutathionylspermidine synthase family protein [Paracoccus sp. (in: a-proteobacteria)]